MNALKVSPELHALIKEFERLMKQQRESCFCIDTLPKQKSSTITSRNE